MAGNAARDLLCRAARRCRRVPARMLGTLAGKGQFLYLAIPPARFYLREAHNAMGSCSAWSGDVKLHVMATKVFYYSSSRDFFFPGRLGERAGVGPPRWSVLFIRISRLAHPEIADLLHAFVRYRPAVLPVATHFWQLPGDHPGSWTSDTVAMGVTVS
eukprot:jgi/Tetstr1/421288/TSEL_012263.t1